MTFKNKFGLLFAVISTGCVSGSGYISRELPASLPVVQVGDRLVWPKDPPRNGGTILFLPSSS